MMNVLRVFLIFSIFSSSVLNAEDCGKTLDPFEAMLNNKIPEQLPNCIEAENNNCEKCLTLDLGSAKSEQEIDEIVTEKLLRQIMDHHKKIMFDFLTYKEELNNKEKYKDSIKTCKIDSSIYSSCSNHLKNVITVSAIESSEVFNRVTSAKTNANIKEAFKSLKKIRTKNECLQIINDSDILNSNFSSVLFEYYLDDQKNTLNISGEIISEAVPVTGYYMKTETKEKINKISQGNEKEKHKKIVNILEDTELKNNIEAKCNIIKENVSNICNGKTYQDENPLENYYSPKEYERSIINQQICKRNEKFKIETLKVKDITKRLNHPVDTDFQNKTKVSINNDFKKKYEDLLKNQATKICTELESSKESRKAVLSKLKEIIEKEPDQTFNKAVADIFVPASIVKLKTSDTESEDLAQTSKRIDQDLKGQATKNLNNPTVSNLSSNNEASNIRAVSSFTAPSPLAKKTTVVSASDTTSNSIKNTMNKPIQKDNTRKIASTESSSTGKNESFPTNVVSDSNSNSINSTPLVNNTVTANKAIFVDIQPDEVLQSLSSPESVEKLSNAEFADKNRPYTDGTSQTITLNEAYFPKEGLNDRNTINPKYLDAYFATFDDDLYYLIQSMNSKVISIKNPYFPEKKIQIDLSLSVDENIKVTKNDRSLTNLQKDNIIQIKRKVYEIGQLAITAKRDITRKANDYESKNKTSISIKKRNELTKSLYEKLKERLK